MFRLSIPVFALIACLAPAGLAQATTDQVISMSYRCERAVEVPVVYVNSSEGASYAIALIDDRLVAMRRVVSASGARYRSGAGIDDYELWGKGDSALISFGPEDDSQVLLAECVAAK